MLLVLTLRADLPLCILHLVVLGDNILLQAALVDVLLVVYLLVDVLQALLVDVLQALLVDVLLVDVLLVDVLLVDVLLVDVLLVAAQVDLLSR